MNKTFCSLPWTHMATFTDGATSLCCVARNNTGHNLNNTTLSVVWNSDYYKDVRLKMLQGQHVPACTRCYEEEKSGYKSHRVIEDKVWNERLGAKELRDLVRQTNEDGSVNHDVMALDLRLGNTCNLQCVMCRPQESSKWLRDAKLLSQNLDDPTLKKEWAAKSNLDTKMFEWYKIPEFWDDLITFLPNMQEIILAGGEPLLIKEQKHFLEKAIDTGHSRHIHLRYHTNGTVLPPDIFGYWEHFKKVEAFVSIDCIGEKNHWIRYPSVWSDIENNLETLDNSADNIDVWILSTLQAVNMYYVPEFIQWIRNKKFKKVSAKTNGYFHPGIVHLPAHLNVKVLPKELKEKITRRIGLYERGNDKPTDKLDGVVNFMNSEDLSRMWPITRKYIAALDKMRGTDFNVTFPEIAKFYSND